MDGSREIGRVIRCEIGGKLYKNPPERLQAYATIHAERRAISCKWGNGVAPADSVVLAFCDDLSGAWMQPETLWAYWLHESDYFDLIRSGFDRRPEPEAEEGR